jgi:hypothetical protein
VGQSRGEILGTETPLGKVLWNIEKEPSSHQSISRQPPYSQIVEIKVKAKKKKKSPSGSTLNVS